MLRIVHAEIENFRSIEHATISPRALCAFVGPNNSGKSNILAAFEFLLGRSYPIEARLDENHFFYRDRAQEIRIRIVFHESTSTGEVVEHTLAFARDDDDGQYHVYFDGRWARGEIRDQFPLIRVGVDRGTRQNQPTNRWTLLGRMLLDINKQFTADPSRVAEFEHAMRHLSQDVLTSVPEFQTLLDSLRAEGARQLGRRVDDVGAELSLHDPWDFYRTLRVVVDECGIRMPADEMGMGVQSSIVIALLRAYALAKRRFYRLLRELSHPEDGALGGMQILYTTHSASMVDLAYFDEICVVRRVPTDDGQRWGTEVRQLRMEQVVRRLHIDGVTDSTAESVRARLHRHGVHGRNTAVFADLVVLVEGDTEVLALPVWAAACDMDLEEMNIAVVQAGGKSAIPELAAILENLGVPCYVIADGDAHNPTESSAEANRRLLGRVGLPAEDYPPTIIGERLTLWTECYERELEASLGSYRACEADMRAILGTKVGKGVLARACAQRLVETDVLPDCIRRVLAAIRQLRDAHGTQTPALPPSGGIDGAPT
jgi:putative ATP-dependent endonuclease of OLD family